MNGLLPLQNGNLSVNGINAGNPANKWELCKICGMVFQNPDNQFVSSVLEEDIAFGLENAQVPEREVTSKVKAALELVGLEGYEKAFSVELVRWAETAGLRWRGCWR